MLRFDIVNIICTIWLQCLREHLINWSSSNTWLQMSLSIEFEFFICWSIEMNAKTWNIHEGLVRIPEGFCDNTVWILVDNLASKSKVSIKPSSPKTSTVFLNVNLLKAVLVVHFCMWSCFKNWWISMTTSYFENIKSIFGCDIFTNSKSNNSWAIPREKISLTSL